MEYLMLYCGNWFDKAYRIYPCGIGRFSQDQPKYDVRHQYGCVCCKQWSINAWKIDKINGELGEWLANAVGQCPSGFDIAYFNDELKEKIGVGAAEFGLRDEALLELADGSYIATNNCD
jgi:hypothetical protein